MFLPFSIVSVVVSMVSPSLGRSQLHGAALLPALQRSGDGPQHASGVVVLRGEVQAVGGAEAQHGGLDPRGRNALGVWKFGAIAMG